MSSLVERVAKHEIGTKVLTNLPAKKKKEYRASDWVEGEITGFEKTGDQESYLYTYSVSFQGDIDNQDFAANDIDWMVLAHRYFKKRVAKDFGDFGVFEGSVTDIKPPESDDEPPFFTVRFDDEDLEDMDQSEVEQAMLLLQEKEEQKEKEGGKKRKVARQKTTGLEDPHLQQDHSPPAKSRRSAKKKTGPRQVSSSSEPSPDPPVSSSTYGRRRRSVKTYEEINDTDSEPEQVKKPAKRLRKSKVKNYSDDSMSYESEESEHFDFDEIDDEDMSDGVSEEEAKPVKRKSEQSKTKTKNTATASKKGAKTAAPKDPKKKSMAESFEPIDRPLYSNLSLEEIKKTKRFLDPCGQEATDDIIGRLVGDQVDKIQNLLLRALKNNSHLGSQSIPLKLGTACSGTDAPALALTLVQEQLELRGMPSLFHYEHAFSCEVEPFKQAYLARNFDSVLYPDICKLTDDEPRDAYGQVQPIPESNIFVAGTSCKNFSMLRANKRLDIEDKGCSGETFLAAVEHIFKDKPPFCILENVQNAPWDKMAEYIEGKIKLSSCDAKKAITGAKKNDKQILEFVQQNGNIFVDRVPQVYGVRCGSTVAGYTRPGDTKPRTIKWPSKKTKCTLDELIKANNISKKDDTIVFDVPIRYNTTKIKCDTKDYGLPQTRNRMYLFVWRVEDGDDLGDYWKLIVEHLKSPVRHSLEAFVLSVDHDIIRVFREALRGPSGRQTKRGMFLENDFWTSTSANLPHNKQTREKLGVEDMARPVTTWGPYGKKQIPPHYWLEFLNCCNQRQLDMLDILHASAARDAESHDSSFASFVWNISQNVTREKHRTACPGISGCVTPGGEFFLPHMGRPLLGCEKLLLQGIPYFRLALGTETEVQLGDLAGNAMSLTVVGATLLAAITCKQLRDETKSLMKSALRAQPMACASKILKSCSVERKPDLAAGQAKTGVLSDGIDFINDLAALADEAIITSIWCTCETSGQNSASNVFLQCNVCKVSCCRNCCDSTAGYQLQSHDVVEKFFVKDTRDLGAFNSKLRNILPPTVIFTKESLAHMPTAGANTHDISTLADLHFNLHRISRERRAWKVVYFARERQVGEALAEFSIRVGEFSTLNSQGSFEKGAIAELRSFFPALVAPLAYGPLDPIAIFKCTGNEDGSSQKQAWEALVSNNIPSSLRIVGSSPGLSFRSEAGLTDVAAKGVQRGYQKNNNRKSFAQAKKLGEERRWLYTKNWESWPDTLEITSVEEDSDGSKKTDVSGTYKRAKCRQSANQGVLWIRKESPTLYLLLKPEVSRTGPDMPIISRSISHEDAASVVAILPEMWQPCDALLEKLQIVKPVQYHVWSSQPNMKCLVPKSSIKVSSPKPGVRSDVLFTLHGLTGADTDMLAFHASQSDAERLKLPMETGQRAQQTVRAFNAVCVSKILQYAASHGIAYDLRPEAEWIDLCPADAKLPFGRCTNTFPPRPKERWRKDEERDDWERIYEPGESRAFYQALEKRPRAFEFHLDKKSKSLIVKLSPEVVAHFAAGHLIQGRGSEASEEIKVSFKLSASQFQSDPVLDVFRVPSCHAENPTDVELKKPHQLYERQKKVVAKMRAIENRETLFNEIEMYEEHMPGSTGWSLIAKAQRNARISGGVIADAIGAGKTVISIALILQGLKESRAKAQCPRQSSATLVVVPSHLIGQWKSELNKFATGLKVFCIYDLQTLLNLSVKDLVGCDCVICPVDILESSGYLQHLVKISSSSADDCPKMPHYTGQKELLGATGVWIPATSADPYGGANNANNQKRRNASARYTHIYLNAVHKLRTKDFSEGKKGVPLEYFEWERIIVDEIHESLCCTKEEVDASNESKSGNEVFKEKNRRAGRELLGIMTRDPSQRPLVARMAIFGLTGTPLLDSPSRVIELASLIGCTYVLGLSSHWRKLERESCRDIFLHYYLEPKQSRIIRRNLYEKCQDYITTACCRNKVGDEMNGIQLETRTETIQMSDAEAELYLQSQSGIPSSKKSFAISPEDFDVSAGHDITRFLRQNVDLKSRKQKLVDLCRGILQEDKTTKVIVFADGRVGGGVSAREALQAEEGLGCTWLDESDSIEVRNQKISWYQHGDATEEDRARPRILVLHFEHAAGLNLQSECYNLILFSPLYIGSGGANSDPVSDVSTELQAIGRVYRPGQTKPLVNVFRIEVRGPKDEECLDARLIRRNTDEETRAMAVNASD